MQTFAQLAEKSGKNITRRRQWKLDTSDRPKVFPADSDVLWTAAHPAGEVAGYIAWFEQRNNLKPTTQGLTP